MDLQARDNIISIASNAVTALGVVGGVVFGGSKLKNYLDVKKNDVAFHTTCALYDEFTNSRAKYSQIRISLNYLMNMLDELCRSNTNITPDSYFQIQEIGTADFQNSLTIGNIFIKTNNFNVLFKGNSFFKVQDIVYITNEISINITDFFACAINSLKGRIVSKEDLSELLRYYKQYENLTSDYLDKCSEIQKIKFEDFIMFTKSWG
ncbi:hypothetical protein WMA84_001948 [Enterobacter hormaechei subsp. xiangfangensis]|uniref:hypothetical protein n=1 Tax=Enterobacter hormaechei TaxID=158836 RepID=UPI000F0BD58E|nr:hypothetical protein [Enterobacter hormaechei]AYU95578.1 hypothetical protein EEI76_10990 [Enterobacter cloacae]HCJ6300284.1 hypothetical protein [Enterobacter hormaechei subsp. xiangfangensis]MCC4518835.1 hypothetical protein [Enterobacter hormaechei]MCC4544004.1 hypothetical protein [Enterobacter hormaechei]MCC4550233.1 hypothetical protein [Enterobacter hormaechei]